MLALIALTILASALDDGVSTMCLRTPKTVAAQATKIHLADGIHVSFAKGFSPLDELFDGRRELHSVSSEPFGAELRPLTYIWLK